jgi:hypothetical protein
MQARLQYYIGEPGTYVDRSHPGCCESWHRRQGHIVGLQRQRIQTRALQSSPITVHLVLPLPDLPCLVLPCVALCSGSGFGSGSVVPDRCHVPCVMLCHAMPCYAMLCHAMPCPCLPRTACIDPMILYSFYTGLTACLLACLPACLRLARQGKPKPRQSPARAARYAPTRDCLLACLPACLLLTEPSARTRAPADLPLFSALPRPHHDDDDNAPPRRPPF